MGKIVISQNVSLDGVVQDPTGEEGFRQGGWFRQFGAKNFEEWAEIELDEALRPSPTPGSTDGRVVRHALAEPDRRMG